MVEVNFDGTVEEYQGRKLDKAIPYNGTVKVPETVTEAKESGLWPNDSDILTRFVKGRLVTSAKAAAYQAATKALKEEYENSADFKKAQLVKAAMAAGFSQQEAEALAASKLG